MKAYNEQWIYNRDLLIQSERWHRQGLLSDDQMEAVRKAYPVEFRRTNGFIEIGLFLFTTVAILACYLLPASIFSGMLDNPTVYGVFNIAFGIGVGIVGWFIINRRLLYRNGIDNAFVVTLTGFLAFGFNQFLPNGLSVATHCLFTLPLLLLVLWYYGDTLIAFFSLAAFYTAIFDSLLKVSGGRDALPFVMMGVSLLLYIGVRQVINRTLNPTYYADPLNLVQWLSLIVLAASGNYFMVRELNGILLESGPGRPALTEAPQIGLPVLFWILTFAIPIIYLWQGLTKRNRMLIILGTLGLIAAVMTVHEYTALVPLNVALTVGGLLLIGLAVAGIRYLSSPKHGFTDAPDDDSPNELFVNAAGMAVAQATSTMPQGPKDDLQFGKGDFGGAGSEGKY
ncbi:hypothetical protein [Spirosoma linguale]|uniref:DUF2157 domain-containing protein n=1 Tax=Spirosoma linguale (strain ATCC 33905 / DSM 74 / LMG 10896 / Claus 1) TaxID=504472 RepID=D2QM78_SPILD|nr:hypothetical protein Slin_3130 [Spirosoma linguale DSM 74]